MKTLKANCLQGYRLGPKFEDELVKVRNKTKFLLNSNYVISLERIAKKNIGTPTHMLDFYQPFLVDRLNDCESRDIIYIFFFYILLLSENR